MDEDESTGKCDNESWFENHGSFGNIGFESSQSRLEKIPDQRRFEPEVEERVELLNKLYFISTFLYPDPVGQDLAKPIHAYLMRSEGKTYSTIALELNCNTTTVWRYCKEVEVHLEDIVEVGLEVKDELINAQKVNPADNTIKVTLNVLFGIWSGKQKEEIMRYLELSPKDLDGELVKIRKLAYKTVKERNAKQAADDFSDLLFPADETVN